MKRKLTVEKVMGKISGIIVEASHEGISVSEIKVDRKITEINYDGLISPRMDIQVIFKFDEDVKTENKLKAQTFQK